ncbi:MAG: NPCBM/NEW2 domain-containing protein [Pirellulales bacterium]
MTLVLVTAALLAAPPCPVTAAEPPPRFAILRADGTRAVGQRLITVAADPKSPNLPDWQLDSQPLWDAPQPARWLRDRTVPLATSPPDAFVEFATGDRLPGAVIGYSDGRDRPFDSVIPHLLVRPETSLQPPSPVVDPVARIALRYVRRVVWQRRDIESLQPGTLFYRDGRSATFRAIRWGDQSAQFLFADGPRGVPYAEVAEVHLPTSDFWDAYWEELAALSPDATGRLWQFETSDGLILTTSRARSRLHHPSGPQESSRWIHGLHPAWSLDALWVPQATVAVIRSFATHESPLGRIPLAMELREGWLTAHGPPARLNRNVQRGPLRGGEGEHGWGFGVHARSRLEFDLPPAARVFRSRVGLDKSVSNGGCVRARVFVGGAATPAYESGYIVGAAATADIGVVAIPTQPDKKTRLLLEVDPAHEGRPANADPFDVRDWTNWLDPLVEFDPAVVQGEIAKRINRLMPAWQDWARDSATSNTPAEMRSSWKVQWDELAPSPGRFQLIETLRGPVHSWTREWRRESTDRWLVVAAHLTAAVTPPPTLEVWIDGELAGEQPLAVRNSGLRDPPPLAISLRHYRPGPLRFEVRVSGGAGAAEAPVTWRCLRVAQQLPTLYQVLEDDAVWQAGEEGDGKARPKGPAWDDQDRVSGTRSIKLVGDSLEELLLPSPVSVRESPAWGEYRYARLAFRKQNKGQISLEFLPTEPREKPLRLDAGPGPAAFGDSVRFYQAELPDQWITMPIDLFGSLGRFDARSLRLAVLGSGPARFDAIYLARTQADFELISLAAGLTPPTPPAREEFEKATANRLVPTLVSFSAADGQPALGVMTGAKGEWISTARALGESGRTLMVTLADGKTVSARVKGVFKAGDLGLAQLDEAGNWPTVEIVASPTLPADLQFFTISSESKDSQSKDSQRLARSRWVPWRRTTRLAIWTDSVSGDRWATGSPLVDQHGRLLGLLSRRYGDGVIQTRLNGWEAIATRLRAGESW